MFDINYLIMINQLEFIGIIFIVSFRGQFFEKSDLI